MKELSKPNKLTKMNHWTILNPLWQQSNLQW